MCTSYLNCHQSSHQRISKLECGKSFICCINYHVTRNNTHDQSLMATGNVGIVLSVTFIFLKDFTLEKGLMSAAKVGNTSSVAVPSVVIRVTLESGLTPAVIWEVFFLYQ